MFVCAVFYYAIFLTAIVARQECAIACCRLLEGEGPITWGPSAWLAAVVVGLCACWVCSGEQLSRAPLAVMAGDGYGYGSDSEKKEKADRLVRCLLGTSQRQALPVWLLTTFNGCLML